MSNHLNGLKHKQINITVKTLVVTIVTALFIIHNIKNKYNPQTVYTKYYLFV